MKISVKKVFACLLMSILVMSTVAGCGSSSSGSGGGGGSKILFIMTDTNDTFRATLSDAVVAAGKSMGVTLDMVETGDSVSSHLLPKPRAKAIPP